MSKFKTWKEELTWLHLNDIDNKAPGFFMASGGFSMKIKPYTDTNTNGLTRCVKDFLTFKGHYVIRTARQGQARVERIQMHNHVRTKLNWTKNPEGKAFTDLQASINGLFVAIEIKCKKTKDTTKDNQKVNAAMVEQSGAIHLIVPDMLYLWNWYYKDLPNIIKTKLK